MASILLPEKTAWQRHVERWRDCKECFLCATRNKVVLARGKVPCDVLLIGEAPGESENVVGQPFVGPAGRLLDTIVSRSIPESLRWAMTNLVACIPRDGTDKAAEPPDDAIEACTGRLFEFYRMCQPKLVVCVGVHATSWVLSRELKAFNEVPGVSITHPAAILRANIAQQGLAVRRCIVTIKRAVEETCQG